MPHRKSQVQAVEVEAPERCCLPTFDHLGNGANELRTSGAAKKLSSRIPLKYLKPTHAHSAGACSACDS